MRDSCTYRVALRGRVEEDEFNSLSPLRISLVRTDGNSTLLSVHTDQSGFVGLLRHLHASGFVILSAGRETGGAEE